MTAIDFKRNVDAAHLADITGDSFYPVSLVRIDWPTGIVEAHTATGQIDFDGGTFVGTFVDGIHLATISGQAEGPGIVATELALTLYGKYAELLDHMSQDAAGRLVQMWTGSTTTPGGNVLIGSPTLAFTGIISGDAITAPSTGAAASLILRAKAGTHGRVRAAMTHSNEGHQIDQPGDTFFERNALASVLRDAPPFW